MIASRSGAPHRGRGPWLSLRGAPTRGQKPRRTVLCAEALQVTYPLANLCVMVKLAIILPAAFDTVRIQRTGCAGPSLTVGTDHNPNPGAAFFQREIGAADMLRPAISEERAMSTILRFPAVCSRLGLSREGVRRRYSPASRYFDPTFPQPIRLGTGDRSHLGFFEEELDNWIALRAASRQPKGRAA